MPSCRKPYDWSRISMVQGLVANPALGAGLVAGYRTSGDSQRPGFAWFFGRDALWTTLALSSAGDFINARTALDFLIKYQRADGKIPHEVSQSANFVPWFKDFPYPYASADATPLFLIAASDYVARSGDVAYAREKWDSFWNAYQFLRSTYATNGLPQNTGVGHGWIEGGPLLPVQTEFYQSGLGAEALRSLSRLALLAGKNDVSQNLAQQFDHQRALVNEAFWSPSANTFAYALDKDGKQLSVTSVLDTVPMWFGLLDDPKANAVIDHLATSDYQTDWGMRIISSKNPNYNPSGYHFGSVWPLFTGWASTAEYRYHRSQPAYANLRANALLSLDGSLGHVTEVLSGDYYQPTLGGTPHQIWSAAMVVNPLLRGLFGLESNAASGTLFFTPHIPLDWQSVSIHNLRIGSGELSMRYERNADTIRLQSTATGTQACSLSFSPALSLRAQILRAEVNGHSVPFKVQANLIDQHVNVTYAACPGTKTLTISFRHDFGLSQSPSLPALGAVSQGMRIVSETWSPARDRLTVDVTGVAGNQYDLTVLNPDQLVSVDGAELLPRESGYPAKVRIQFPSGPDPSNSLRTVTFNLTAAMRLRR